MLSNLFISCYVSDAMCSVLFKVLKTQVHLIFIAILWRCCCLGLHGLQHARIPCPSLSPWVCSNSCPLMLSNYFTLSRPLLLLPSIFPSIRVFFSVSWLFASDGQSIGASASVSVLPVNIQGWFSLGLTGWSPSSPRDSQKFFPTPQSESIYSWVI